MNPSRVLSLPFQPLILLLLLPLFLQTVSTFPNNKIPRLSPFHRKSLILRKEAGDETSLSTSSSANSDDFQTYYYTQTLDHFNYGPQSYATFKQKYVVNSKYWGGQNSSSPIFVYLGAESPLDAYAINSIGIINDNAPHFKALTVFIEHRFYGESIPFGTMEEAMKNKATRGYFSSAQALDDYAEILLHVKNNFSAHTSPIIVFGGSYGGMLATWFRLKYPHIALGALASSAPILYFDNITPQNGYLSIVTKDFQGASQSCYEMIKKSWAVIDRIASIPEGLTILSQRFRTCSQLSSAEELKNFLMGNYASAAQYNYPPQYVRNVCEAMDGAPAGTDLIGRIFAGVVAYYGSVTCYATSSNADDNASEMDVGWNWQTCSEMVMPIGCGENDTMFEALPFDFHQFIKDCEKIYGVPPRSHWITNYYGGHDIKLVLKRFGSNIIFSNGLQDPYSSGGVLEDINDNIVAVTTLNGSHCVDLAPASETDPEWLITQRKKELETIEGWLAAYYADLHALKMQKA